MAVWYARNVRNATGTWGSGNFLTQAGPQAAASGTITLLSSSTAFIEQPTTKYFCASIRMADGTPAPNGITVHIHNLTGLQLVDYPNGLVTTNHPVGHPTYGTGEAGWVCFNHTALSADQINHHLTVLPQATLNFESGVSIEVLPQTTNNGNG